MLLSALVVALAAGPDGAPPVPPPAVFVDVTVIPMTEPGVRLAHHDVVIRDGRIAAIRPTGQPVPEGATVIDGRGRYLVPGLVDMHAHLVGGAGEVSDGAGRQLRLSLAMGITTIRSLISQPAALSLRDRIGAGELVMPRLVLAGGSVNGQSAPTGADVVRVVTAQHEAGFDLVKTHGMWSSAEPYDSLVAVTARLGVPLVGHVGPEFGLRRAMDAGQQVEHLDGFIAELVPAGTPGAAGQFPLDPAVLAAVDEAKLTALAGEIARRGLWNAPTLELFEIVGGPEPAETYLAREEMRYVPPMARDGWANQKRQMHGAPVDPATREAFLEVRRRIVRALRDAGAPLLASSDSPQFFMVPGYGLHREMQALEHAGLTPWEALATATVNPARWFGDDSRGTVAEGMVADLALLGADPTARVANAMDVDGTMLGGVWHDAEAIVALKEAVAAAVGG